MVSRTSIRGISSPDHLPDVVYAMLFPDCSENTSGNEPDAPTMNGLEPAQR
ncbi:hypothetical protein [Methanogenium sp. MK-MG]|uniref:hypothetical protein n=1 Tax=Methanogenium sp. MK-MG TaxID=2599926 RepID=UPI0013EE2D72|nr:hypothetical protein [Methanogenium sp. MK-MG]